MTTTDPAATIDTGDWGGRHAHDPTAVRDDDGTYWLFSTDAYSGGPVRGGVQVRRSQDLVTWQFHGWALDGVPTAAAAWTGAEGLWAPEVVRVGTQWRMYYSASTFGSRTSAIGLATAPVPAGPWADQGLVVTSRHEVDGPNAIDANVVVDEDGRHWLVYGSFFGGIHAVELDPATGFALGCLPGEPTVGPGVLLARRPHDVEAAIEGAFVLPRPGGGWALIVSYDSLFSTYHVRVGVAEAVTGPYRDRVGNLLTDVEQNPVHVGTTVLASHRLEGGRTWLAPGHASVLTEGSEGGTDPTRQLLVHHVRDGLDPHQHEVQVRRLVWTDDGWPLVSPQPWAGDHEADDTTTWPSDPADLLGEWEVLTFAGDPSVVASTRTVVIDASALLDLHVHGAGRFRWHGPDGATVEAVAFPSWDAVRARAAVSFAAIDDAGRVTCGTRLTR